MVNPGAFRGSRKLFLLDQKEVYSKAVAEGHAAETVAHIQRQYFKRYPIDLPHEEEPSAEDLAAVDDDAIDPDYKGPDAEKLTPEEYGEALTMLLSRQKLLEFRRAQIKRWLAYQYMKDQDLDPKETGAHSPYRILLSKLTGKEMHRPRLKTPANIWRRNHKEAIETKLKTRAATEGIARSGLANLREKIAKDMFKKLSEEDQLRYQEQAAKEHAETLAQWTNDMDGPASTSPEDRQRCIMGLVRFAQPILDLISEATGWKATLMAGGPEPAQNGRLNIISVHSGTTTGDTPMNFGRAERIRYKASIVPIYGSFLQKCYSPEECRSRSLGQDTNFLPMESLDLEGDNASFDTFDQPPAIPPSGQQAARVPSPPVLGSQSAVAPVRPPAPLVVLPPASVPHSPSGRLSPPPSLPPSPSGRLSPPASLPPDASCGRSPPVHQVPPSQAVPHLSAPLPTPTSSEGESLSSLAPLPAPSSPTTVQIPVPAAPGANNAKRGKKRARSADPPSELEAADSPLPVKRTRARLARPQTGSNSTRSNPPSTKIPAKRGCVKAPAPTPAESAAPAPKKVRVARVKVKGSDAAAPSSLASAPTYARIEVPEEAPEWLRLALSMLQQDVALEGRWKELLHRWAAFELEEKCEGSSTLKSTHRPAAVGGWIQRGRSPTWRPTIADVDQYRQDFTNWWTFLQPDWRISNDDGVKTILFEKVDGDWGCLRKPGVNGLVSVMAALFYWGRIVDGPHEKDGWLVAVEDCLTALLHLV